MALLPNTYTDQEKYMIVMNRPYDEPMKDYVERLDAAYVNKCINGANIKYGKVYIYLT